MSGQTALTPGSHWVDLEAPAVVPAPTEPWLRAAAAVAETMFATHEGPAPAKRVHWMCVHLADFQRRVGGIGMFTFRAALFAFSWLAPLVVFSLPPFRRLGHTKRMKALHRFERSPIGVSVMAVKALLCMIYFEHPESAAQIGFTGAPLLPPANGGEA